MSSLRDLHVEVDIQDGATASLNRIDGLVNRIGSSFQQLGGTTNRSLRGFNDMNGTVIQLNRSLNGSTRETRRLDAELRSAHSESESMRNRLDQAEREAQDLRLEMQQMARHTQRADSSMSGLGSTLRGMVGLVGTVFAVDKIKDFVTSGIQLSADKEAINSQFGQIFGGLEQTASNSLNAVAKETGILPERLKGSYTQIAAFTKTTGADTAQAMSLAERATLAAADAAAFNNSKIEDVTGSMQSFLKGKVVAPC